MGTYFDARSSVVAVDQSLKTSILAFDEIDTTKEPILIMNGDTYDRMLIECDDVVCMPVFASYDNCEGILRNMEIYLDESIMDDIVIATSEGYATVYKLAS